MFYLFIFGLPLWFTIVPLEHMLVKSLILSHWTMGFTSTDIDECENDDSCKGPGEKCFNIPGNFTCPCIEGYHLDRSAGVDLCVINQSSLQVKLFVGKYILICTLTHLD